MRVRWAESALDDIDQIVQYVGRFNPAAARRVAQALLDAGESLCRFPTRGRIGGASETRELVAVWPYVIVYELTVEAVHILRVWHGARNRDHG